MTTGVAITLGDPAGIGPEVALKSIDRLRKKNSSARILLLGKASFYSALARRMKLNLSFMDVADPAFFLNTGHSFACYHDREFPKKIRVGRSDRRLTVLAVRSIEIGASLAMRGIVDAIVTPPINKAGLRKAGFKIPGHTEYLAKLSGTKHYEMMLVGGKLRVVPVTRHVPIKNVPRLLSRKRIRDAIILTARELKKSFGVKKPRIVVCGLNPHAGEEGVLGREEIQTIAPAVRSLKLKKIGARITGPLSPDALFHDAYLGRYDAEICMYHDQGLIPLKMISRGHGVNVTLGLPFVRTSPDHGTGYDIAGTFRADPGSMTQAIRLALTLSRNRKWHAQPSSRNQRRS